MDNKSKVDKWIFAAKNHKVTAPIIFAAIAIIAVLGLIKNIGDAFFKNGDLVYEVKFLKSQIDTIELSLAKYELKLVKNRAVPIEINPVYGKNGAGTNYGHVGDEITEYKTINQTKLEKPPGPLTLETPHKNELHNVEIESQSDPKIERTGNNYQAVFLLKSKNREEAENLSIDFAAVFPEKGKLEKAGLYVDANTTVLTNYPTEFSYSFTTEEHSVDTIYVFLKIKFSNSVGQIQPPYQVLYRRINKPPCKLSRLSPGTKEYKDVIELVYLRTGL